MSLPLWIALGAALFSVFPLTDTDIWWHLSCAREGVSSPIDLLMWTPSKIPWLNIHAYFQNTVYFIFNRGAAPFLVAFKAFLWGIVFFLFLYPFRKEIKNASLFQIALAFILLFIFRFHFEIRPVLYSLLYLGVYWNFLHYYKENPLKLKVMIFFLLILWIQFIWNKTQGLFLLGPLLFMSFTPSLNRKKKGILYVFITLLFLTPFLHQETFSLFFYPFALVDRLLGISSSAFVFSKMIVENRSPFYLLWEDFNFSRGIFTLIAITILSFLCLQLFNLFKKEKKKSLNFHKLLASPFSLWFFFCFVLSCLAERNIVLFLPILIPLILRIHLKEYPFSLKIKKIYEAKILDKYPIPSIIFSMLIAFLVGFWIQSLQHYDVSMISKERVPVNAVQWMKENPHSKNLLNDDRAGGYISWALEKEKTFIDGRFILKSEIFFRRYLAYTQNPEIFALDASVFSIDRVVLPIQYDTKWSTLIRYLLSSPDWTLVYKDDFFVIFDDLNI